MVYLEFRFSCLNLSILSIEFSQRILNYRFYYEFEHCFYFILYFYYCFYVEDISFFFFFFLNGNFSCD